MADRDHASCDAGARIGARLGRESASDAVGPVETAAGVEDRTGLSPQRIVFRGDGTFLKTLRGRVDAHFAGRRRCGDPRLYRKALVIAVWFAASYGLLLASQSVWTQLMLCVSYALAACALAFNVFHDTHHGAFSCSKRVNAVLGRLTCIVLGPARHFWWQKHHVLHHRFTNIFKWDDDVESRGYLRLSPRQPWRPKYRHQHRFFSLLYALNTLEWFFVKDFVQYFSQRVNPYQPAPAMTRNEKLEFWLCKAAYFGGFVALPFLFLPAPRVVVGLLLFHLVMSLSLTLVFQLAHLTETAEFPVPTGTPITIEDEWAAHQMRTTTNFAMTNPLVNWFTGGLNFQIEHHLFPHISHTHYPDISAIVRRTAREFGLPYNTHHGFVDAVRSHYRMVRELAAEPRRAAAAA